MTYKTNIPSQFRTLYVSEGGDDQLSGESISTPKQTIAAAITAADLLTPTPTDNVAIIDNGASTYTENVVMSDDVLLDLRNCTFLADGGASPVILASENATCNVLGIRGTLDGQVMWDSNSKVFLSLDAAFIGLLGPNQTAMLISGSTNSAFIDVSQVLVVGTNCIVLDHTSSEAQASYKMNEWTSAAAGTMGLRFNSTSTDNSEFRGGAIRFRDTRAPMPKTRGCLSRCTEAGERRVH